MTHEQQLKQLLTEAEQVTAKMREALAKMGVTATPPLATTYEEVAEAVKPTWICACNGKVFETEDDHYQLPTKQSAKQDKAFIQIKNLEAYCAANFEGDRNYVIDVRISGTMSYYEFPYGIIKITEEAAEWLIENHPEPFLIFFGVK